MSGPCLIMAPQIRALAKKFPNETENSVLNLVGLWQEKNKKSVDEVPAGWELNDFIKEIRGKNTQKKNPSKTEKNASSTTVVVETFKGNWTRNQVAEQTDKVFLFGDNTQDRTVTKHVPRSTQAVIRGLDNAIGIDTKKDRGTKKSSYFTDDDFEEFKIQVDAAIKQAIDSGKTIVIPEGGIGTGKAQLAERAPKLYNYLQSKLAELQNLKNQNTVQQEQQLETESNDTVENNDNFYTPKVTSIETQQKVDLLFNPMVRRQRVSTIARFFSNEINNALQEIQQTLRDRIETSEDEDEIKELTNELNSLDRFSVLNKYTPAGIFKRVYDIFDSYVKDTEENRIQQELNVINSMKGAEKYSDEKKLEAAKKKAAYKYQEYSKIIGDSEVFRALAEESSTIIMAIEGIVVDPNYITAKAANLNEADPEGNSTLDGQGEEWKQEEIFKDGWMTSFREVSSHESLSQAIRKIIATIPRLDYRGKYSKDDLGFTEYLDADYTHVVLIDALRNMITSEDMIPLLQTMAKNKPWVKQIIKLLQNDDALYSQFYQDFRKDFTNYWIQKKKMMPDGSFKMVTISLNTPEGIYYLLDAWRDNYESGIQLDKDSVYEKNGELNEKNAAKGLSIVEKLTLKFQNLDTEARLQLLEQKKVWDDILKVLHMIGIDADPTILKEALTDIKEAPGITFTDPIMLLLPQLNIIFSGIKKGKVETETDEEGNEQPKDLINNFGSAYNTIANMLADITEDAIESSIRENDKSYYAHTNPNYLGKLIKNLKNVMNDKERFEKFMQTEFKDYDWFYKNGEWRNDWLSQLSSSEEMRKGLQHKVVLNSDKVEYKDWDDLDYTLALLTEYWGDPESAKSNVKFAWYYVPILSDSPSAEFIRFRKYTTGDILDEDGRKRTYDDVILDKLTDIVNQEYDRIMLVRERDAQYQQGNPEIEPIANYDISRDKNGNIKSLGGAEFKFFPALNNIKYGNGETFLERLSRLKNEGTGAKLKAFIRDALNDVMEEGFEQTCKEWENIGLFEELPNGKCKYLPFAGQSKQNAITAKTLMKAKEALGSLWTTNMEMLLRNCNNNKVFNTRKAEETMEQIENMLYIKVDQEDLEEEKANAIIRGLFIKNNTKEALREYYWNSKLATSQIIQLTTTDLAFYKNLEDFQKRFKEIHAPSLRLNTLAMYKGERIGREWERTILLKDDEIVSSIISDVEEVFNEKVKKGEMSKIDKDYILNQYKKVNVADAQAYRSLSSYRAILGMSGQWTDEMEQAYNNFKNGNWNIQDFSIIWQTKKPFVYTQVNNSGIKTPVQHKNSEFLLLAMHDLIAGATRKSSKLKALNEYMEKHQIDVIQFESTTKAGKQGVIDLNSANTKEEVFKVLDEATGIGTGNENPNVVHKISYEDYGIQTATPEHLIDTIQLLGTQIRKLITADISDDAVFDINGKNFTKKELLDLYNSIITENIIQSFSSINKIFKDPKEVEKILLEEIRGSKRYGMEMARACTLDKNGNFNIPLFDPVQSQRIQTLLNSIIKSRITKQKIRGGAAIQVSDYGLTDELKIVFEGKGKNKRIKYAECYLPAYSKEFFEPFMDPETHQLDINKLPEELRRIVGYRVPTEDKYSMLPLRIKGFLPQQNGSAIMLPAEITTLSGSDRVNV